MIERRGEIDASRGGLGERFLGGGIEKDLAFALALLPGAANEAC